MNLYRDLILEHWQNPRNSGRLTRPTHWAKLDNPLCGDIVRIELKIEGDKVSDISFSGEGCVISQASASLLTEEVRKLKVVKKIKRLDGEDIERLLGVKVAPARSKCATLALETLKKALNGN